MSKFFFFETATMELLVEGGNASGGAAVQTLVWMEGLSEIDHQIFQAKFENDQRKIKTEYQKFNLVPIYNTNKGIRWLRWPFYRFPKTFKALKKIKPDYVYESVPFWGSFITNVYCRVLGIKHIIRISNDRHLDNRFLMVASKWNQQLLFLGLKQCDLILVQNNFQLEALKKKFKNQTIKKIYNPIKINREFNISKNEMTGYFVWIANFRFQKNLKLLFEIAESFQNEEFIIAGVPKQPYDKESTQFIEKLKCLPNVKFLGKVDRDRILPLLKGAKFLLNTSRFEGFSNTFLEAMVTGTPILSTPFVNPDGIIENNKIGIIYNDVNDLREKINSLSNREYLELSTNSINYVCKNHDYIVLTKLLESNLNGIKN